MELLANCMLGGGIGVLLAGSYEMIANTPRGRWPGKLSWAIVLVGLALIAASGLVR